MTVFITKYLHIKTLKTHEATVLKSINLQVKFNREAYCYSTEGLFLYTFHGTECSQKRSFLANLENCGEALGFLIYVIN